jgi:hypothetical protein
LTYPDQVPPPRGAGAAGRPSPQAGLITASVYGGVRLHTSPALACTHTYDLVP